MGKSNVVDVKFKVLFLALSTGTSSVRDKITYPFLVREIHELASRGVEVIFLKTDGERSTHQGLIHFVSIDDLLEESRLRRRAATLGFMIKNVAALLGALFVSPRVTYHMCTFERACVRAISLFSVDIVHTHFGCSNGGNALLSAKANKIPVVSTIRGAEIVNRPDLDYGAMRNRYFRRLFSKTIRLCTRITVPNRNMVKLLTREFGVESTRVQYLPNGINLGSIKSVRPTRKSTLR